MAGIPKSKTPKKKVMATARKRVSSTATNSRKKSKPLAAKKAVAKKVAKKKVTTKSGTSKKTTTGTRLVARSVDRSQTAKTVALEQLFKKPDQTDLPEIKQTDSIGISIRLPNNMSLRSISKAKAISIILSDRSAERVRRLAYATSFGFILLGGFYTLGSLGLLSGTQLTAALPLSATAQDVPTPTSTVTNLPIRPVFEVIDSIPEQLQTEFRGSFKLTGAEKVTMYLHPESEAQEKLISLEQANDSIFHYSIPGATLAPDRYSVRIVAWNKEGSEYLFTVGRFKVAKETKAAENETLQATSSEEINNQDVEASTEVQQTESVVEMENKVSVETSTTTDSTDMALRNFEVFISDTVFSKRTIVYMSAPQEAKSIEIYLRPKGSYNSKFLTAADKTFNTWRFTLDPDHIPSGTYELFARGVYQGLQMESTPKEIVVRPASVKTPITNDVTHDDAATLDNNEIAAEAETNIDNPVVVPPPPRDFSELSLAPPAQEARNDEPEKIATELLRKRKSNLEVLLRNYSAAKQAGDETMMRLANEALDAEIVALSQEEDLTSNIEKNVVNRIASLRARIDTFEELRRNANDGITALDTDQDGISDFDERALYQTDPNNPDSDNDGVLDGVEIMKGFDPADDRSEAVLAYESPRDVIGLVRNDVLSITDVSPVVETDESLGKPRVQSKITGKGLPNSYVTLYIFSTPIIVTLKTDDTGSFVYTFEKELENGTHEVYVAITDNAGSVIAHSEPFAFVKEAEAFTPVAEAAGPISSLEESDGTPYATALGLGVLALGLVLLMLGIGLRTPHRIETNLETAT